jgi:DNA polymerase-3 subunit alpha/error-prone DNA polymerase
MAYQAVYLKVHHPVPYFAAVLNAGGGYYDLAEYVAEAKRNGIRILAPDANRSLCRFEVEGGSGGEAIRVGLGSIKGLGTKTIDRVIGERTNGGGYVSVEDFLARTKPTKAELLALIRAGVFDSLEPRRTHQILRYFQGLEHMEEVADVASDEKRRMLCESLGFLPDGDELDLYEGKRPELRIRDLKDCAGTLVELVVRVVDARERVTYGANGGGNGGARPGGAKYFYLFEDETGILEGIGESRCVTYGTPPVCLLRGEVRRDGEGIPKIYNCAFLRAF